MTGTGGRGGCTSTVVGEVTSRYDNYHHGLEHAAQAEVISAGFLHRSCVIGSPDHCVEHLCELVDLGPSHLVIVGGSRDIVNCGAGRDTVFYEEVRCLMSRIRTC